MYMIIRSVDVSHVFTGVGSVPSAGSAVFPPVIVIYKYLYLVYHTVTGIIIGTRTVVRVLYETAATDGVS